MTDKLVSIITPCYNAGKFIHRLLDSILEQDYPRIEMYIVDDGSVDETEDIIKCYISKFTQRGYVLFYIFQENAGQSVAINRALKLVKGDYLVWPDSDDFYASPIAISKMVSVLNKSDSSVSMVRCLPMYLDEKNLILHHKTANKAEIYNEDLFEDCLFAKKRYWFVPGDYMAKMAVLDKCIKDRDIYTEKDAGQNWQLMLPLLYSYRCITIGEYLYNVVIRKTSHSRGQYKTFEEECYKLQTYKNTLICSLEKIEHLPLSKRINYINELHEKYLIDHFDICLAFHRKKEARVIREKLKGNYHVDLSLRRKVKYACCMLPGYDFIKEILSRLKY